MQKRYAMPHGATLFEEDSKMRIGFLTDDTAYRAADKRGLIGVTGWGRSCCTVMLRDESWGYWTDHDHYHPEKDSGAVLILGGREIDPTTAEGEAVLGIKWMIKNMFTPISWIKRRGQ